MGLRLAFAVACFHAYAHWLAYAYYPPMISTRRLLGSQQVYSSALSEMSATPELNNLLGGLEAQEKYELLIKSYTKSIMLTSTRNQTALLSVETLYSEMLKNSIKPTSESTEALINAASTFCSSVQLGRAIQLAKAAGELKAFGVAVGQLTTPVVSALTSSPLLSDSKLPYDQRDVEVLYAGGAVATATGWLLLQALSSFSEDLRSWATLVGCVGVFLCGLDFTFRKGLGLKLAVAGFDRLLLKDSARESHCDGASFLLGYLLGLPCFCFDPDVGESLKLLQEAPDTLNVFRQTRATRGGSAGGAATMGGFFDTFFKSPQPLRASTPSSSTSPSLDGKDEASSLWGELGIGSQLILTGKLEGVRGAAGDKSANTKMSAFTTKSVLLESKASQTLALGRLLVWLLAPVAAEKLRYGKTVIADPRRARKFVSALGKLKKRTESGSTVDSSNIGITTNSSSNDKLDTTKGDTNKIEDAFVAVVPESEEDQEALLQWAYYEAELLVRQYGDILELLRGYIGTGVSSVAECVMTIEDQMV